MSVNTENQDPIRLYLLKEMKSGKFSECDRLPRETVLANELGIGRNHLRDILASMEREGFVTRRQGVGTLINHHVLHVKNRMDIETEFLDIISNNGYTPDVSYVHLDYEKADGETAGKLKISEGTEIVRISRVCTADGKPAIYCEDVLEKRFVQEEYTLDDLKAPIFSFLKNYCQIEAYMDLTSLNAVLADEKIAGLLEVKIGTPLLNMEEIDYDIDGNIVFYSNQYFRNEYFDQVVLRKKL